MCTDHTMLTPTVKKEKQVLSLKTEQMDKKTLVANLVLLLQKTFVS
jgi:hypothetical protein